MRCVFTILAVAGTCGLSIAPAHAGDRSGRANAGFNVTVTIVRKCTVTIPTAVHAVGAAAARVAVGCSAKTPYSISVSAPRMVQPSPDHAAPKAARSDGPLTLAVTY